MGRRGMGGFNGETPSPQVPVNPQRRTATWLQGKKSNSGVALVLVLAFIVLVTGLIVAFFSRSLLARQISNSSASQTKVELFAQGAMDTLISDLKQEIAVGSAKVTGTTGNAIWTLYTPTTSANAVPSLVGSTGSNGLENLLKVSGTGAFYPAGPARGCLASTTGTSLNGRFVSAARWNKPLLMPVTSATNYAPSESAGYTPPSWILVARDGSNPKSWANTLKTSGTNSTSVVGRYAYAIYNEGGLLDANLAGYPIGSGSAAVPLNAAYKPAIAYADLAQLGLTTEQVDSFVGWRNYASTQATGTSFTSPGFTANSGSAYYRHVTSNSQGFLSSGTAMHNNQADRMFVSRQQLLSFLQNGLGLSAVNPTFQGLGTFSRALNQPALAPDFTNSSLPSYRKPVVAGEGYDSPGNSAYTFESLYNPKFLSVRVASGFTRNDGSTAEAGEPLVKKRFALNRLAWLTYKGASNWLYANYPSDGVITADLHAGLSPQFLAAGTEAAIYRYFGLTRRGGDSLTGYWEYDHKISSDGRVIIGSLQDARDAGREPDFFELLKAAIHVGSVAKGVTAKDNRSRTTTGNASRSVDQRVDFQILQIGANIIDQFDIDSYPTCIQLADRVTLVGTKINQTADVLRKFYGKEDLPYLQALHSCATHVLAPSTDPAVSGTATIVLEIPSIWNPVDLDGSIALGESGLSTRPVPTRLRATMVSKDPWDTLSASTNRIAVRGYYTQRLDSNVLVTSATSTMSFDSREQTAIEFNYDRALYRQPTLLAQTGQPFGSELMLGSNFDLTIPVPGASSIPMKPGSPVVEVSSGMSLIGWPNGAVQTWTTISGTKYPLRDWQNSRSGLIDKALMRGIPDGGRTVRLEWADGGAWQPYFEAYWEYSGPIYEYYGPASQDPSIIAQWAGGIRHTIVPTWDPRTTRFWHVRGQAPTWMPQSSVTNQTNVIGTLRPGTTANDNSNGAYSIGYFSNYDYPSEASGFTYEGGWVFPGMAQQNNPIAVFNNVSMARSHHYYSDPDGVVRRAMGAYVPSPNNAAPPASVDTGLPLSINNSTLASATSSRPIMLDRPFRNVGELGYVFRDTPWKNLDFFTPESGDCGLLDLFCITPDETPNAVVAGKVDLNTRNTRVLAAILSGALRDELKVGLSSGSLPATGPGSAQELAQALVARTGTAALTNLSDLVGRHTGTNNIYGQPYDGFSGDPALAAMGSTNSNSIVQRLRNAPIRALAQVGDVRVWNLMIDLVAQSGRYPQTASNLGQFNVEAEQRYWVHLAIDRLTGQVIDKQIEIVKE